MQFTHNNPHLAFNDTHLIPRLGSQVSLGVAGTYSIPKLMRWCSPKNTEKKFGHH